MKLEFADINAGRMDDIRQSVDAAAIASGTNSALAMLESPVMRSLDDRFRTNATQVLARFRTAVERVVYSLTKTLQNSRTLQSALGVDLNVSWQVFKLLGPIETLSTVSYVPAAVSIRKLTALAKKKGVAAETLEEVTAAHDAFEVLVAETTGDREQFESLVMSFTDSPEGVQIGMQLRKGAFKAHAHFFGAAADTVAFALMFHPGSEPGKIDFCGLRTVMGLRRMRANTDVVVERWKVPPDLTTQGDELVVADAMDPDSARRHGAPVLPEFCSQPLLPMTTVADEAGNVRTLLQHDDLGVGQEVDITTGRVYRGRPMLYTPEGQMVIQGLIEIGRPTRLQVIDTFVHRPTWPKLTAISGVFAHLTSRNTSEAERNGVRMPCPEKLIHMGSGHDVLRISEAPRYPELVKHACQKMGWSFEDMDLYRIRLEYPLMDSNVLCRLVAAQS